MQLREASGLPKRSHLVYHLRAKNPIPITAIEQEEGSRPPSSYTTSVKTPIYLIGKSEPFRLVSEGLGCSNRLRKKTYWWAAFRAGSKSAMMSSACSMPTEILTIAGSTPALSCSAGGS